MQGGFDGFAHNPEEYATALTCPALFMHGSEDPRAKEEEGRRVFDAVAARDKQYVLFEEVGHYAYLASQPEEWRAALAKTRDGITQVRPQARGRLIRRNRPLNKTPNGLRCLDHSCPVPEPLGLSPHSSYRFF